MSTLLGGSTSLSLLLAAAAHADHCALPTSRATDGLGLSVALAAEVSAFATERFSGEVQGGRLTLGWDHPWVRVRVSEPYYRVTRNGPTARGFGDLALDLWGAVYRAEDGLATGLRLSATAPVGNADDDLGMGHAMLGLAAWLDAPLTPAVWLHAEVGFARALVASLGEHAHGPMPLVDPMNASEVTAAVGLTWPIGERFLLRTSLGGALPAGVDDGEARGVLGLGGTVTMGPLHVQVDGAFPLVGDPFEARLTVEVGATF